MKDELYEEVPQFATLTALAEATSPDCSFAEFTRMSSAFEACLATDVMRDIARWQWVNGKDRKLLTTEDRQLLWLKEDCGMILQFLRPRLDPPEILQGSPGHRLIGLVAPRTGSPVVSLDILVGRHQLELDPELFDPDITMPRPTLNRLQPGTCIALEEYWNFYALMPAESALLYAVLVWEPTHRYRWDVDVDTLRPTRIVSVDDGALRTAAAARTLGRLPAPGNVHSLEMLVHHDDHNVRWEATRSLFALDRALGLAQLCLLAEHDPNVQLRQTAKLALEGSAGQK